MPKLPRVPQLVTQLARVGSGAIKRTTPQTRRAFADSRDTKFFGGIDIPDGFFAPHTVRRWDAPPGNISHVLVPRETPSGRGPCNVTKPVELDKTMMATVEIASTPTADTQGSALVVDFPHRRYLFGHVGEGTQRTLTERKVAMAKMGHVFLSGPVDWHAVGGLMGMVLTLADTFAAVKDAVVTLNRDRVANGKPPLELPQNRLDIHGGRNLVHAIATTRRFIYRRGTPIRTHEIRAPRAGPLRDGSDPDWQDDCLQVWYLPLPPSPSPAPAPRDDTAAEADADADADNQLLKEHLVASMFNADWKLDVLRQMRLLDLERQPHLWVDGFDKLQVFERDPLNRIQKYKGPWPGQIGFDGSKNVLFREPCPMGKFPTLLAPTQPSDESLCYIVKTHPRRGKFDGDAARKFGVEIKDYKLLIAGHDVVGRGGAVIKRDMVVGATRPGTGWIVADIRAAHQVQGFLDRPEWADKTIMQGVVAVYWILADDVATDARLVQWMRDRPEMKHILLGKASSPNRIVFERQTKQAIQMNLVDPDRFPLPLYLNEAPPLAADLAAVAQVGRPKETLRLANDVQWPNSAQPFMSPKPIVNEVLRNKEVMELAQAAREKLADPVFLAQDAEAQRDAVADDVVVTPLGTGSSMPSKLRNVSANLVQVPLYGNYLFDCGENTLGQLRRSFGYDETDAILEGLRVLYVSHAHADHHLGAASVLARRAELVRKNPHLAPLTIVAADAFISFVKEYGSVEDLGLSSHVAFVQVSFDRRDYYKGELNSSATVYERTEAQNGVSCALPKIEACRVDHCQDAMACVFTWPTGLRVAYSGDCRPSDDFATLGLGADLLIHECTFESELQGEAVAKKHSTMAEALDVGRKMYAKRILLTHFSQRYAKFPIIDNTEQTVLYAFDLMRIKLHDFKKAALFLPALQKLLEDNPELDDASGMKEQGKRDGDEEGREPAGANKGRKAKKAKWGDSKAGESKAGKSKEAKKPEEAKKPKEAAVVTASASDPAPAQKGPQPFKALGYAERVFQVEIKKQEKAFWMEEEAARRMIERVEEEKIYARKKEQLRARRAEKMAEELRVKEENDKIWREDMKVIMLRRQAVKERYEKMKEEQEREREQEKRLAGLTPEQRKRKLDAESWEVVTDLGPSLWNLENPRPKAKIRTPRAMGTATAMSTHTVVGVKRSASGSPSSVATAVAVTSTLSTARIPRPMSRRRVVAVPPPKPKPKTLKTYEPGSLYGGFKNFL